MKTYRIIHIIANVIAFGVLAVFLIYAIAVWDSIPDTIGVHFDANIEEEIADFNIYGSKWFALFPFVAGFGLLGIFSFGGHIANKVNLGLKVDEQGEKLTRAAVNLYLDALKVCWGIAFAHWADCVIHQHGMYTLIPVIGVLILFFGLLVLSLALLVIRKNMSLVKAADKKHEWSIEHREVIKDALAYRIVHLTTSVASFTFLGGYLVFMLIIWWSLPDRIGIHFGPGSDGGLADYDVTGEKIFAFYPFWAGFGLLILFSLLQLAAKKVKLGLHMDKLGERMIRSYVCLYLDLHKVVWAAFFSHWADCVIHQTPLRTVVPQIGFILLLAGTVFVVGAVIVVARRHRLVPAEASAAADVESQKDDSSVSNGKAKHDRKEDNT